jgi:hypothetical protein
MKQGDTICIKWFEEFTGEAYAIGLFDAYQNQDNNPYFFVRKLSYKRNNFRKWQRLRAGERIQPKFLTIRMVLVEKTLRQFKK